MAREDNTETGGTSGHTDTSQKTGKHGIFPQTRWTLVQQMQNPAITQIGSDALNQLCQEYWQPVYIYIRSWGKSSADAEDLTQGFFAMILSRGSLDFVAPEKGKLRTFLLVALKRYLAGEHHRDSALKRGGGNTPISIDLEWEDGGPKIEIASNASPDVLFDRQWALTVLDQVVAQLKDDYSSDGKGEVFEALRFTISQAAAKRPLAEVAAHLGITEGAAKVASHRLRQRYRQILTGVIAETVESEDAVREEIGYLMSVFQKG
jgi:DNA-directed RNA polymerase specialized sigma24 family protein